MCESVRGPENKAPANNQSGRLTSPGIKLGQPADAAPSKTPWFNQRLVNDRDGAFLWICASTAKLSLFGRPRFSGNTRGRPDVGSMLVQRTLSQCFVFTVILRLLYLASYTTSTNIFHVDEAVPMIKDTIDCSSILAMVLARLLTYYFHIFFNILGYYIVKAKLMCLLYIYMYVL